MSRLAVALVVCLVLLAGCSGFAGGDESSDREPYGVEEPVNASIEDEPEELLPGLTTEGVTNSAELRETHAEVIGDRPYTIEIEYERVVENDNESFRQTVESTLYVDPEARAVHEVAHQRFEGNVSVVNYHAEVEPNRTDERWYGEETVSMTEFEDGSVEYTPPQDGMLRGHDRVDQASMHLFGPLESVEETTTAGAVESEEGIYYVLEGWENTSEVEQTSQDFEIETRTLVREDGLVRQTAGERVHVQREGERTLVNQTVEVTAVGETTVERPDWYEEAIEAQPEEPDMAGPNDDGADEPAGNESADGEPPAGSDVEGGDSSG